MNNKDEFLRKLRWQTGTKEFENMCIFQIDCFMYVFDEPLTFDQQNKFVDFIPYNIKSSFTMYIK